MLQAGNACMATNAIDLDHLARYTGGEKALNTEILQPVRQPGHRHGGRAERACSTAATPSAGAKSPIPSRARRAAWALSAWAKPPPAAEPVDPADGAEAKAAIQKLEHEAETVRALSRLIWLPKGI